MSSPSSVITRGLGSWGSTSLLLTRGLGNYVPIVAGPFRSVVAEAWAPSSISGQAVAPGDKAAEPYAPGSKKGQSL
jgi:hypothetical protein